MWRFFVVRFLVYFLLCIGAAYGFTMLLHRPWEQTDLIIYGGIAIVVGVIFAGTTGEYREPEESGEERG